MHTWSIPSPMFPIRRNNPVCCDHVVSSWHLFNDFNDVGVVCNDLWDSFVGLYESCDADCCVVVFLFWCVGEVVSVVSPDNDSEPGGVGVGLADVEKCWLSSTVRCIHGADCGAGGGLVFLISGGKTHEMAPKNWDEPTNVSAVDPTSAWCSITSSLLSGTFGTVVGTGQANTALMVAAGACTSGAANSATAPVYSGGGYNDWFLPSKDELNAMYTYSKVVGFNAVTYGFVSDYWWSSSQFDTGTA